MKLIVTMMQGTAMAPSRDAAAEDDEGEDQDPRSQSVVATRNIQRVQEQTKLMVTLNSHFLTLFLHV